jgi:very-short-patch-repair endonuclease
MKKKIVVEALNPLHGTVNYLKELKELARKNRNNPTEAEEIMWNKVLRDKRTGYKFLRQKPIDRFIADFYCSELNIVIEVDGGSHNQKKAYDEARDVFLKQVGISTIRFTNDEVINNIELVRQKLVVSLVKGRGGKAERDSISALSPH